MEKWRKTFETYSFSSTGVILNAFYGSSPVDNEEIYGLELENSDGDRISSAGFKVGQDILDELKNPKELLKYRAVVVEAEGLPEETRSGLVRLLQKIEEK